MNGVKLHARRAVEGDKSDELVPGEGGGHSQSAPGENFVLVDERVARGKEDGDASLGTAARARDRRAGEKGSGRKGRFPNSSVGEAPMCFLQKDGATSLEPAPNNTPLVGCLVGVSGNHPANVPSSERGPSINTALRKAIEQITQREGEEPSPGSAQAGQLAMQDELEGSGGADMVEAASEAKGLLEASTGAMPSRGTCDGEKPRGVGPPQGTLQGIARVVHALSSTAAVFGRRKEPSSVGSRSRVDVASQQ